MNLTLKPKSKIFISYSRKDELFAEYLNVALQKLGYAIFYDKEHILVGENFVSKINVQVRKTDALIFILSTHSMQSEWCKAEVYSSFALGKQFIPLQYNSKNIDTSQLFLSIQKNINYIEVTDESDFENAVNKINLLLSTTRKKVLTKWVKSLIGIVLSCLMTIFLFIQLTKTLNEWSFDTKRKEAINRLKSAAKLYTKTQIELNTAEFKNDSKFKSQIYELYSDQLNSDIIRFNSLLVLSNLESVNNPAKQWYLENIEWKHNEFINGNLNTVSFSDGVITDITFSNSNFNNTFWGARIGDVTYKSCNFFANLIEPKSLISANYENCIFRGCQLYIKNMGAVHFYFKLSDSTSSVITGEIALFENCVLKNCVPEPDPKLVELLRPDSEVRFSNILFESCHFQGFIRTSWFNKCAFSNCVFPPDINIREMEENKCTFINNLFSKEPCF